MLLLVVAGIAVLACLPLWLQAWPQRNGNWIALLLPIHAALAWTLALPLGWAHSGVFWGVFVSETAVGVCTLLLFSRGRWKTVKV